MNIPAITKSKIEKVINVFETGSPEGDYSKISMFRDGPLVNGVKIKQVTYGRSQTTEFGNLKKLVEMYANANGQFSQQLKPFVSRVGKFPSLCTDPVFLKLLKDAGKDPIMQKTQDNFFDLIYYLPAMHWSDGFGFKLPLSLLVIYDSFIHSGGMLDFLRNRFPEMPPSKGGDEKTYIKQYVKVRHNWLNSVPRLQATTYRTKCFLNQVANDNWKLDKPVMANGVKVN